MVLSFVAGSVLAIALAVEPSPAPLVPNGLFIEWTDRPVDKTAWSGLEYNLRQLNCYGFNGQETCELKTIEIYRHTDGLEGCFVNLVPRSQRSVKVTRGKATVDIEADQDSSTHLKFHLGVAGELGGAVGGKVGVVGGIWSPAVLSVTGMLVQAPADGGRMFSMELAAVKSTIKDSESAIVDLKCSKLFVKAARKDVK